MMIILVIGLLIYGRRLPQVGVQVGRQVAQLRRGLSDFKEQIQRDEDLRSVRDSVKELRDEMTNLDRPRIQTSFPDQLLDELTDPTQATPAPPAADEQDKNGSV